MLHTVGPLPLVEPERLKTETDWIEAGRRVFDELDHFTMRNYDPDVIAKVRTCAIQGHRFGLGLRPEEQEQLIAFLRTL